MKIFNQLEDIHFEKKFYVSSINMKKTARRDSEGSKENVTKPLNLLFQRDRIYYEKGIKFNIMICGQKGVGKTTIIEKLFDIDLSRSKKNPNIKEHIELTYNNKNKITINLVIHEFSSSTNNKINNSYSWMPIVNEIKRYSIKYCQERQQLYRNNDLIEDRRIHVCLYVLEPKQTTSLDLITMKEICQITNIIPIIYIIDVVSDINDLDNLKYELQRWFEIYDIVAFQNNNNNMYNNLNPVCIHKNDISNLQKLIIDETMIDLIDSNANVNFDNFEMESDKNTVLWWEEKFLLKQINLQRKYKELIELQNGKFQEWIKMLIEKQRRFNTILEQLSNQISLIRNDCQELERKLITIHEANSYMSYNESAYTINCSNSSKTLVVTNGTIESSNEKK